MDFIGRLNKVTTAVMFRCSGDITTIIFRQVRTVYPSLNRTGEKQREATLFTLRPPYHGMNCIPARAVSLSKLEVAELQSC